MLFALAAIVGLTFPLLLSKPSLVSISFLALFPSGDGVQMFAGMLDAGSSQDGYFFGRNQEIYSLG